MVVEVEGRIIPTFSSSKIPATGPALSLKPIIRTSFKTFSLTFQIRRIQQWTPFVYNTSGCGVIEQTRSGFSRLRKFRSSLYLIRRPILNRTVRNCREIWRWYKICVSSRGSYRSVRELPIERGYSSRTRRMP